MKNIEVLESNYPSTNGNYKAFQLKLPLDISTFVPVDDLVTSFVNIMKGMDTSIYFNKPSHRGNKGYDPHMMLQVVLFAYMNGIFSLRKIEELCHNDIRFIWLCDGETPSFMAFQRFISDQLTQCIEDIFYDFMNYLIKEDNIDTSTLYIDGTKIEANARKNSFVWKKAILGYQKKSFKKASELIESVNKQFNSNYKTKTTYKSVYIGQIADELIGQMAIKNIDITYGKGKRKTEIQRYYDEILSIYLKLKKYEEMIEICGERNSYSKTDHDATMMNMKYDYYNKTGVFKPGYNVQIGVSDGYIMHLDVYPNPTDTKTYIPFIKGYKEKYGSYPKWPIGDAGYGSYDNLMFNVENGMELGLKYSYYRKKNEPQFKKQIYNSMNWERSETGNKICPEGNEFNIETSEKWDEKGEYLQIKRSMICGKCSECPVKNKCTKAAENRSITENYVMNELYEKVDENLGSEEGKEKKKQRSIQAEGTFGVIKQDMNYVRIHRRGKENVKTELYLVGIGYNLRKYHYNRLKEKEKTIS